MKSISVSLALFAVFFSAAAAMAQVPATPVTSDPGSPGMTMGAATANPAGTVEIYHRVRTTASPAQLSALGIAADHGLRKAGLWFEGDFSETEVRKMESASISHDVIIRDMANWYGAQAAADPGFDAALRSGSGDCLRPASDYVVPAAFTAGSMGGYYTLQEVYNQLDSMAARYPSLVSAREPVGTVLTHQGRQQFMVKISDNVNVDESAEPNVLYTALIHAREPAGMMAVIFYMQWVLENYGVDPRATYVIDRTQMYFVPVVNPDGYEINRLSNPSGGGLWRKNARDNGASTGVDLNRNWPYLWGYDDGGSSPTPSSDVYRGPSAGSEPEIVNLIGFAEERNFRTAFNYHSFGDLLIFPWGYEFLFTPDHGDFRRAAKSMIADNGYTYGTPYQTVLYAVNGSSDDWFYGEQTTKDKTFSWTPEVGEIGFWPPPSQIIPMSQENALANLLLAFYATRYATIAGFDDLLIARSGTLRHKISGYGEVPVDATVRLQALTANLQVSGDAVSYSLLEAGEEREGALAYSLTPETKPGDPVSYAWVLSWDGMEIREVVHTQLAEKSILLVPEASWVPVRETETSPWVWSDSPNGFYANSTEFAGSLGVADLTDATSAWLCFSARWELESGTDYVLVEASTDGQPWEALCGLHTRQGTTTQSAGIPVYSGSSDWVNEKVDLSSFAGGQVNLRIRLLSDNAVTADGFDLKAPELVLIGKAGSGLESNPDLISMKPFPNPANGEVILNISAQVQPGQWTVSILDAAGVLRATYPVQAGNQTLDLRQLDSGIYLMALRDGHRTAALERLVVVRP